MQFLPRISAHPGNKILNSRNSELRLQASSSNPVENRKYRSYFDKIMLDSKLFLRKSLFLCIGGQAQGITRALSLTQKPMKLTFTFLEIFFAPSRSKKKCLRSEFVIYMECSKTDRICHFMMDFEKCLILR